MSEKIFLLVGGDTRQKFLFDLLSNAGFQTVCFGLQGKSDTINDLERIVSLSDIIILPLPVSRDNKTINGTNIQFTHFFSLLDEKKKVFGGNFSQEILAMAKKYQVEIFDYFEDESLVTLNVIPTCEGAIDIAMQETVHTIFDSKCLVVGYGRIGKLLSKNLRDLGADVTVSARKQSDISLIKMNRHSPVHHKNLCQSVRECNIIFNTVPSLVLDKSVLENVPKNCLIIDLASMPGGVDMIFAKELGIKCLHALSLPGKVAPYTAAGFIKNTILNNL